MELDLRAPWRKRTRRSRRRTTSRPTRSAPSAPPSSGPSRRRPTARSPRARAPRTSSTRSPAPPSRVREMIEDIHVLEDLKRLRTEVETLTRRVAALEDKPAPAKKPAPAPQPRAQHARPTRKPAASSTAKAAGTARSTAAKRSAAQDAARAQAAREVARAAKPRSTAPPRSPLPPPDGLAAVRVRPGVREVMDQIFAMMSDDPEMGPGAARRRHAAALRVRRPRPGRQHPRRRGGRGQPALGVVRRRRRGSRRCG